MKVTSGLHSLWALPLAAALIAAVPGCNGGGGGTPGGRQFLSLGTAPVGGAFYPVGTAVGEVLNNHAEDRWKVTAKATKGTRENIRRLERGDLDLALANGSISYHAVRGIEGFEQKAPIRTLMTLAPNVGHFITLEGSSIKTIADLKGKRVGVGPAGAGFEFFLRPLLEAHGVSYEDFTPLNNTQSGLVDLLADGAADAVFLGGAMPQPSITQACSSLDIFFIPYDAAAREKLIAEYSFFSPITVPASTYSDLEEDFAGLNVGSMHLITTADADEELIYALTKVLWENRSEVAEKHNVGKAINETNAARYTGTDFHSGAERFYREVGIWPGAEKEAAEATPTEGETGTSEPGAGEPAAAAGGTS